jgi:hypothetical protein
MRHDFERCRMIQEQRDTGGNNPVSYDAIDTPHAGDLFARRHDKRQRMNDTQWVCLDARDRTRPTKERRTSSVVHDERRRCRIGRDGIRPGSERRNDVHFVPSTRESTSFGAHEVSGRILIARGIRRRDEQDFQRPNNVLVTARSSVDSLRVTKRKTPHRFHEQRFDGRL